MATVSGSASTTTRNPRHWQLAILVMATLPKFPTSPSPSPLETGELLHGRQPSLRAISGPHSLDHLVGAGNERRWNCQPHLGSRLQVDDQLKFSRELHRQVTRLGAFQYSVHVSGCALKQDTKVSAVDH